jgi:sugar O-acyltransferase (sialic acid O-acetyltransferase NeuD family)
MRSVRWRRRWRERVVEERPIVSECELVIIGAGGHGREVRSYVEDLVRQGEPIRLVGFVDEKKPRGMWAGVEILGGFEDLEAFLRLPQGCVLHYITAVGDNATRQCLVRKAERVPRNVKCAAGNLVAWTLRHPMAIVGDGVEVGEGSCLAPGSIVTTRVRIGKHCIVNVNASISHDCAIGDFVNVNPGAVICGNVRIGEGCYIGAGATVIDGVSIGEWTVVGAGAVVIDDLPPRVTAVGVPARAIKENRSGETGDGAR